MLPPVNQQQPPQAPPANPQQTQTPPMNADKFAQLEKLAQMKERGILTDEEFQQEKAEILNG